VIPVIASLLAGQLVVALVLAGLLGFFVYRARALMNTLAKSAAGTEWASNQMAQVFDTAAAALSATAASAQLSATAAAASSVAIQAIARDIRPMTRGYDESTVTATVDLSRLETDDTSPSA
jgi:hypothetical protein